MEINKASLGKRLGWFGLVLASVCLLAPSQVRAGGVDVLIGLNFGFPGYYVAPPPPVVVQQPPVVVEAPPVYIRNDPVVVYRSPVVVAPPPRAYYYGHKPPGHAKKHHKHHKHRW
ncbi:hypothetical protein [Desulfoferrobacter suflitae]|uniref:hypothetical protein n=1 Tax=Desulfoferrobacter suflitae TaxID=2865782 RepID=UPI002164193A|nr:hypothetical protein [Desulfoferrobacter suflitae]MCK8601203.1 hypothetical protein [Desulfoferrobacter suflitae]